MIWDGEQHQAKVDWGHLKKRNATYAEANNIILW